MFSQNGRPALMLTNTYILEETVIQQSIFKKQAQIFLPFTVYCLHRNKNI